MKKVIYLAVSTLMILGACSKEELVQEIHQNEEKTQLKTDSEILNDARSVGQIHNQVLADMGNDVNFPFADTKGRVEFVVNYFSDNYSESTSTSVDEYVSFVSILSYNTNLFKDKINEAYSSQNITAIEKYYLEAMSDTIFGDTTKLLTGINNIIDDILADDQLSATQKETLITGMMIARYSHTFWSQELIDGNSPWFAYHNSQTGNDDIAYGRFWEAVKDAYGWLCALVQGGDKTERKITATVASGS